MNTRPLRPVPHWKGGRFPLHVSISQEAIEHVKMLAKKYNKTLSDIVTKIIERHIPNE